MNSDDPEIDKALALIEPSSSAPVIAHDRSLGAAAGRPVVVVLGMHRSGTSLLASVLHFLGADMADETDKASRKNETGFWERPELVALQDRVLDAIGRPIASPLHCLPFPAGWWRRKEVLSIRDEIRAWVRIQLDRTAGLWGFKDPRTCRLLPMWWDIFRDLGLRAHYVVAVRSPAEAAISMAEKNRAARPMTSLRGELMWLAYNYDIFRYARDADPIIVNYADWFGDPCSIADMLSRRLGLHSDMTTREQVDGICSIVRADLRHHSDGSGSVAPSLAVSSPFYRSIAQAYGTSDTSTERSLDRHLDFLHALYPFLEPVVQDMGPSAAEHQHRDAGSSVVSGDGAGQQQVVEEAEALPTTLQQSGSEVTVNRARPTAKWNFEPTGHLMPNADSAYNIGDSTKRLRYLYGRNVDLTGRLVSTQGTIAGSNPFLKGTATWNNGRAKFFGVFLDVTNVASGTASRLISLRESGNTKFDVTSTGGITVAAWIRQAVPRTITAAADTVRETDTYLIANFEGTVTLSLPTAAKYPGRRLVVKTITSNGIVSDTSSVQPPDSSTPGTAIVPAAAGKAAELVSDGSVWIVMTNNL